MALHYLRIDDPCNTDQIYLLCRMIQDQRLYSIMYVEDTHRCNWSGVYSNYQILRQLSMALVVYKNEYRHAITFCMNRMRQHYRNHTLSHTFPFQEKTREQNIGRCTCELDPNGTIFHYVMRQSPH